MSILDDAIREHLELKRQHGADDAELKKLEDEAFGPPARPEDAHDPFAEAPTEFLVAPGADEDAPGAELDDEEPNGGRRINVADLQEPPPPSEEQHPAMEHEAVTDLPAADEPGHSTEERHAIAEQPTEIFDVEGELGASSEADSPSDEQLLDAELNEPRLAPVDPIEGIEASAAADAPPSDEEIEEHADEFDEFFSEQRLSDELNQALEAPLEDEPTFPATEEAEAPQRNFAEEEEAEPEDYEDEEEPEDKSASDSQDDESHEHPAAHHDPEHQDALEDTPDFLADDPEDENLWFEQKPPKDIDFGD